MKTSFPLHIVRSIAIGLLLTGSSLAAPQQAPEPAARPRIGLVLGGGGARGTAHIGVLDVLEKMRVPVDCIAGTSMGALVAGGYASGLSSAQMADRLSQLDWRDLFEDNPSHAELNYREKRLARSYYPGLEMGKTDKGLQMAYGIVGGQKIKLLFNTLVGADRGERLIEDLPLPLAIIATDIGDGKRVAFRKGNLSTAMRASMSVPTLLAPVNLDGKRLVDGGLVDNLPIDEVKALCNAEVVIAVDVGSPLLDAENVNSIFAITAQMINILTEQNANAARAQLKPEDIYIKPDLEGITAADFEKFREGAARGRTAAEAAAGRLQRHAMPEAQYAAWQAGLKASQPPPPRIDDIQITGLKHVNPEAVSRHLHVRPGDQLDTARLERDLGHIYGDGYFESVDYSVLTSRERNILRVTPVEKSWGPDYLRFGLTLEASSRQSEIALRGAYHKRPLNALGGEWLSGVQLGERASVFTEFYQPLDARQRFFIEPALGLSRDFLDVYQNDRRAAQYIIRERRAFLNLGANVGIYGQVRAGRAVRRLDSDIETGALSLPTGERRLTGWTASLDFDRFDRTFFPTKGWYARLAYFREDELDYGRLSADLRAARSWGPYVLNGRFYYVGSPQGQLPVYDAGALGGFLNLSGFSRDQIIAGDIRFASLRGEKLIGKMPLGLGGDMRIGLALETGNARQRFSETGLDGWLKAAAIYLGGETPLGPVYLGYGIAKGGHSSLYLFVGLP